MRLVAASIAFVGLAAAGEAAAAPSTRQIPYSGTLEMGGRADADAEVPMRFQLCDGASGGRCDWSQDFPSVPVRRGRFSVSLGGAADPFDDALFDGRELFLEVAVDGRTLGRQRILSVPSTAEAEALRARLVELETIVAELSARANAAAVFGPEAQFSVQNRVPAAAVGSFAPFEDGPTLEFTPTVGGHWLLSTSFNVVVSGGEILDGRIGVVRVDGGAAPEFLRRPQVLMFTEPGTPGFQTDVHLEADVVLDAGVTYRVYVEFKNRNSTPLPTLQTNPTANIRAELRR